MNMRNDGIFCRVRARAAILAPGLLLVGIIFSGLVAGCAPASATDAPTVAPATVTPSPSATATLPVSPAVIQGLKDAFNCLTNNLNYAPSRHLTEFCPGYWGRTSANMQTLDGTLLRKSLEPSLYPLRDLRWRLTGITDIKKDEGHSTNANPIYTATLSTTLSGDATLACPSGTPAPFETTVSIPINGEALISVFNYLNGPVESVQILSWAIEGNPLEDYCAGLQ